MLNLLFEFKNGQEVIWQEASGDTITGEIINVFRENGTGALTLSVSDGRRQHKVRASEVSIVARRHVTRQTIINENVKKLYQSSCVKGGRVSTDCFNVLET